MNIPDWFEKNPASDGSPDPNWFGWDICQVKECSMCHDVIPIPHTSGGSQNFLVSSDSMGHSIAYTCDRCGRQYCQYESHGQEDNYPDFVEEKCELWVGDSEKSQHHRTVQCMICKQYIVENAEEEHSWKKAYTDGCLEHWICCCGDGKDIFYHEYIDVEDKKRGTVTKKCKNCMEADHVHDCDDNDKIEVLSPSTCCINGRGIATCTICGAEYTAFLPLDSTNHQHIVYDDEGLPVIWTWGKDVVHEIECECGYGPSEPHKFVFDSSHSTDNNTCIDTFRCRCGMTSRLICDFQYDEAEIYYINVKDIGSFYRTALTCPTCGRTKIFFISWLDESSLIEVDKVSTILEGAIETQQKVLDFVISKNQIMEWIMFGKDIVEILADTGEKIKYQKILEDEGYTWKLKQDNDANEKFKYAIENEYQFCEFNEDFKSDIYPYSQHSVI